MTTSFDTNKIHDVIILGAGPAGLTAGIYTARANLQPIIIAGPKPGGQLMGTTVVENWPGNKSIMGPELMINMQEQAKHCGAQFIEACVTAVDFTKKPYTVTLDQNKTMQAQTIIITTGATPNRLNCPGEDEFWGKGVSTCVTCDGAFYRNQKVVVVGGGDSSMEAASFLHRNGNQVTIVHIGEKLSASIAMQQRVFKNPDIKIIYSSTVNQILGNNGKIESVEIINKQTKKTDHLDTAAVFLAIGLKPNTQVFADQLECTKSGHLLVTDFVKTSIPGIFAAGDVVDPKYRQAIVSAGFGCIAALEAERYLESL